MCESIVISGRDNAAALSERQFHRGVDGGIGRVRSERHRGRRTEGKIIAAEFDAAASPAWACGWCRHSPHPQSREVGNREHPCQPHQHRSCTALRRYARRCSDGPLPFREQLRHLNPRTAMSRVERYLVFETPQKHGCRQQNEACRHRDKCQMSLLCAAHRTSGVGLFGPERDRNRVITLRLCPYRDGLQDENPVNELPTRNSSHINPGALAQHHSAAPFDAQRYRAPQSPNRSAARALALAASSSRFFAGACVSSRLNSRAETPATSSTAARNAASFACDGFVKPLIFRTNCSEAARISSSVTGGSKLNSVLIFLHIAPSSASLQHREHLRCIHRIAIHTSRAMGQRAAIACPRPEPRLRSGAIILCIGKLI